MSAPLHKLITDHIRSHGYITVHDYMQLCLQHPEYGYYRKAQAVGREGDFITAPEISQLFGDLLALWLIHAWQVLGEPRKVVLVELGPGRGTLAVDVMRMLKKKSETAGVFSLHLVESNETLRGQQAKKLWHYEPQWHDSMATVPADFPLFIIANEFFDALPIRQFIGTQERKVILQDDQFAFAPEGAVTGEACPQAGEVMQHLCQRLQRQGGCALIIDYGYVAPSSSYAAQRDTLQAIKNHAYHPVLSDPGEADLTAHVDFGQLAHAALNKGLHVHGPVTQGAFLQRIGGDLWLQKLRAKVSPDTQKELEEGWLRLVSPNAMGELFKIMALTPNACDLAGLR